MGDYRLSKETEQRFTSFEELGVAYGIKKTIRQTKDKEKLEKQRERFSNRHICRACKNPMTYVGGNIMCCCNDSCKGIAIEKENFKTGEKYIVYENPVHILDDIGAEIASNLFADLN